MILHSTAYNCLGFCRAHELIKSVLTAPLANGASGTEKKELRIFLYGAIHKRLRAVHPVCLCVQFIENTIGLFAKHFIYNHSELVLK